MNPEFTDAEPFLPALSFQVLTRWYDPLCAKMLPEAQMKQALIERVAVHAGQQVLDLGCGTGTLLAMAAQAQPLAHYTGLDVDAEMLAQAQTKIAPLQIPIELVQGSAGKLPFADASFDIVWSSLAFHHLNWPLKQRAAFEIERVLRPGGSFYLLDFTRPRSLSLMLLVWPFTRWLEETYEQLHGRLPWLLKRAGLTKPDSLAVFNTWIGTVELLAARKPC